MKALGRLARYLLSINTIWGLLILAAFVLTVLQHYLPTTSPIPLVLLHEGENTLSIDIVDRKKVRSTHEVALRLTGGALTPLPRDPSKPDAPYVISVEPATDGFFITWDSRMHGDYQLALGDAVIDRGKLIRLETLSDAAFDYAKVGFDIALGLIATMVLFLGLMKIGEDAGLVQLAARAFHPLLRFLYPQVPRDHPANGAILMNMTTTMLGLGNASTPFGLKAMKELQSLNPHPEVASNAQVMMIAYNTAGFALIPTSLIAVRKAAGCSNALEIIGTCMFAGAASTIVAIVMVKLLDRLPMFSVKAALADDAATPVPPISGPPVGGPA